MIRRYINLCYSIFYFKSKQKIALYIIVQISLNTKHILLKGLFEMKLFQVWYTEFILKPDMVQKGENYICKKNPDTFRYIEILINLFHKGLYLWINKSCSLFSMYLQYVRLRGKNTKLKTQLCTWQGV